MQPTISREAVLIDRRQPGLRWSAVFAGTACSVGFWMLLQLLGLGIGLAAVNIDDAGSLRGVGIGTTVWSLVSPLIAMFFGGMIAGKFAQTPERKLAGAHGLVMWAITSVVGLGATVWIVTMLAGSVASAGSAAVQVTGNAISSAADQIDPEQALDTLGIDADDLLAPINQRLAAQGKPAVTVAQLRAAMRGVARDVARGGFDRDRLINQLAANTALSRDEAADIARQIEARWDTVAARARELGQRAGRYALNAADATGKALATVGLSLLLSLIASVGGAALALGRSKQTGGGGKQRGARYVEPGYPAPPIETSPFPSPVPPPTDLTSP
jgi:hypothetical protein